MTMMLQFAFWMTALPSAHASVFAALATLAFVGLTNTTWRRAFAELLVPNLDKPVALLGATSGATLGAYLFHGHPTIALLIGISILAGGSLQILQTHHGC